MSILWALTEKVSIETVEEEEEEKDWGTVLEEADEAGVRWCGWWWM